MTLLDDRATSRRGAVAIGSGWIRGRVVVRPTTIHVEEIRRVVLFTDEAGSQSIIVEAGRLRGVAVPVQAIRDDAHLAGSLRALVADAARTGATVQPAVLDTLAG